MSLDDLNKTPEGNYFLPERQIAAMLEALKADFPKQEEVCCDVIRSAVGSAHSQSNSSDEKLFDDIKWAALANGIMGDNRGLKAPQFLMVM